MKLVPVGPRLYAVPFEHIWYDTDETESLDVLIPQMHPHPRDVGYMALHGIYHDGAWYIGSGKGLETGEWFGVHPDGRVQPPWRRQ